MEMQKSSISNRFITALDILGISAYKAARRLGTSDSVISKIKKGRTPNAELLESMLLNFPNVNGDWLLTGKGSPIKEKGKKKRHIPVNQAIKPILVTVNEDGRENITLVPVRAQAGYLTHYNDQSYIQELPAFHIPIPRYQTGTFRAFEVEGFSMQSFTGAGPSPGDIVIARYVDDPLSMRDSRVYVIISTEGVLIKRIINRLGNDQKLILKSDNKSNDYPDILLEPEQIMEVWEFKAKISAQIPPENAYELINRLQGDVAILTSEVKELKNRIS